MSELTITVLRIGFVILLWLFVFSMLAVLRTDLFGTTVVRRTDTAPRERRPSFLRGNTEEPAANPQRTAVTQYSLVVIEGALRGTSLPLGSMPIMVGRAPECMLVLDDDYASSKHARIFKRDQEWYVEDLGSTNGTLLADAPLHGAQPMHVGVPLRIGTTVLELRKGQR